MNPLNALLSPGESQLHSLVLTIDMVMPNDDIYLVVPKDNEKIYIQGLYNTSNLQSLPLLTFLYTVIFDLNLEEFIHLSVILPKYVC